MSRGQVAKLADAPALGAGGATCEGSSPSLPTACVIISQALLIKIYSKDERYRNYAFAVYENRGGVMRLVEDNLLP